MAAAACDFFWQIIIGCFTDLSAKAFGVSASVTGLYQQIEQALPSGVLNVKWFQDTKTDLEKAEWHLDRARALIDGRAATIAPLTPGAPK